MVKSQNGNEKALKHIGFPHNYEICLHGGSVQILEPFRMSTYRFQLKCCLPVHTNVRCARSCPTRTYLIAWFPHLIHSIKKKKKTFS